jgi:hypothetical protein
MPLALDLLQAMRKVEKGGVSGSFLIVGEHQSCVVMHPLTDEATEKKSTQVSKFLISAREPEWKSREKA